MAAGSGSKRSAGAGSRARGAAPAVETRRAAAETAAQREKREARAAKAAERAAQHLADAIEQDSSTAEDEEIRAMVLGALREVGGREYLTSCARDPRTRNTFLNLCARVGQRSDASLGAWSGTININTGVRRG